MSDEKHSKRLKNKIYVATTVANGCILGAEACADANEEALTAGYGVFAKEAENIEKIISQKRLILMAGMPLIKHLIHYLMMWL